MMEASEENSNEESYEAAYESDFEDPDLVGQETRKNTIINKISAKNEENTAFSNKEQKVTDEIENYAKNFVPVNKPNVISYNKIMDNEYEEEGSYEFASKKPDVPQISEKNAYKENYKVPSQFTKKDVKIQYESEEKIYLANEKKTRKVDYEIYEDHDSYSEEEKPVKYVPKVEKPFIPEPSYKNTTNPIQKKEEPQNLLRRQTPQKERISANSSELIQNKKQIKIEKNSTESKFKPKIENQKKNRRQLEKENLKLRTELKALNEELSIFLETATNKIKIKKEKPESTASSSQIQDKKLKIYENEYLKVKEIYDRMNDTEYLSTLKEEIKSREKKVHDLEKKIKLMSKSQHNREKKIENFDEKELAEQKNLYLMLQDESLKINEQIEVLQDKCEKEHDNYEKLYEKEVELEEKLEKVKAIAEHYNIDQPKIENKNIEKYQLVQKKLQNVEKNHSAALSQLKVQENSLKNQNESIQKELKNIKELLGSKTGEYLKIRNELENVISIASNGDMGKFVNLVSLSGRPTSEKSISPRSETIRAKIKDDNIKDYGNIKRNMSSNSIKKGFDDANKNNKEKFKEREKKAEEDFGIDEDIQEDVNFSHVEEKGKKPEEKGKKNEGKGKAGSKPSLFEELEGDSKPLKEKEIQKDNKPSIFKELEKENKPSIFKELEKDTKSSLLKELEEEKIEKPVISKPSLFQELESKSKPSIFKELDAKPSIFQELNSEKKPDLFKELESNKKSSIFKELEQDSKPSIFRELEPEKKASIFQELDSESKYPNKKSSIFQELENDSKPFLFKESNFDTKLNQKEPISKNIESNLFQKPNFENNISSRDEINEKTKISNLEPSESNKRVGRPVAFKKPETKNDKLLSLAENASNQEIFSDLFDRDDKKPSGLNYQPKLLPVKFGSNEKNTEEKIQEALPKSNAPKPKNYDLEEEDLIL